MKNNKINYPLYLIIDLEATCCDKQSIPRNEMEIIEIGAIMVEASSWQAVDEFQTFIKPKRHPKLTPFCSKLTSIRDSDLAHAPNFPAAIAFLKDWLYQYDQFLFCSWGDYDRHQLKQDSDYHGIPYPLGTAHLNLKKQFSLAQGIKKKLGMARALKTMGYTLEGTHHRGIDDARNMVKLMPHILD